VDSSSGPYYEFQFQASGINSNETKNMPGISQIFGFIKGILHVND